MVFSCTSRNSKSYLIIIFSNKRKTTEIFAGYNWLFVDKWMDKICELSIVITDVKLVDYVCIY